MNCFDAVSLQLIRLHAYKSTERNQDWARFEYGFLVILTMNFSFLFTDNIYQC